MLEFYVEVHDEVSCIFFLCLPLPLKSSEKGKFQRSLSFARKSSSPQQSLKTSFHFAFGSSIFDLLTQLTLRRAAAGEEGCGDVAALRRPPLRKQTLCKDYWLTFKVVGKLVSTINLFWLGGLFVVRHASSFFLCPKKQTPGSTNRKPFKNTLEITIDFRMCMCLTFGS